MRLIGNCWYGQITVIFAVVYVFGFFFFNIYQALFSVGYRENWITSCKKMTALCLYPLFMEGRIIENPREKQDRLETGKTVSWDWSHRTALQSFLVNCISKRSTSWNKLRSFGKSKLLALTHVIHVIHFFNTYKKERYIILINPVMTLLKNEHS